MRSLLVLITVLHSIVLREGMCEGQEQEAWGHSLGRLSTSQA